MNTRPKSISPSPGKPSRSHIGFLLLIAFAVGLGIGVPLGAWLSRWALMHSSTPTPSNEPPTIAGPIVEAKPQAHVIVEPIIDEASFPSPATSLEADILRDLEKRIPKPILQDTEIPIVQSEHSQSQ